MTLNIAGQRTHVCQLQRGRAYYHLCIPILQQSRGGYITKEQLLLGYEDTPQRGCIEKPMVSRG